MGLHSRRYIATKGMMLVSSLVLFGCDGSPEPAAEGSTDKPTVAASIENSAAKNVAEPVSHSETKALALMATNAPQRQNISDVTNNPEMLSALQKSITTMRANSSKDKSSVEFRTSLQYWANIHGYFGPDDALNATSFKAIVKRRGDECLKYFQDEPYQFTKANAQTTCDQYFEAVDTSVSPDSFSKNVWGTCQHTNDMTRDAPRFLPWHRLYLYYFERTLRKYSEDPNFALPYWNYFDYPAADGKGLYLPPVVNGGGSTAANTLFDPLRTLWLNDNKVTMNPDYANAEDAFQEPDFVSFSNSFEGIPHGMMHCATGNGCATAHMGWVPVAGNDPLFYMHHANIDRLWQCWLTQKADGATIDLAWAKENLGLPQSWYDIAFDFVDENGEKVTKTIADAFSPEVLAVSYSNFDNCPDIKKPKMQFKTFLVEPEGVASFSVFQTETVQLKAKPTSVQVPNQNTSLRSNQKIIDTAAQLQSGTYLLLDNIMVNTMPSYTYGVYISSQQEPEKQALVTIFNFFGFGDHTHQGHDDENPSLGSQRHYIEDDLSELNIQSANDILVHFVPMNRVTGKVVNSGEENPITIEKVSIINVP